MKFLSHIIILLCTLQTTRGLTLNMRNSCGVIGNTVFLDCSLEGDTWVNGNLRQWKISPPLTLLFDGGSPKPAAVGYQEIISNVGTTGIFSLEITSLEQSHIGKQFSCLYNFDTAVEMLSQTDVEDYKNTNVNQSVETTGLHIKGTITLDAINPVPIAQAILTNSSITDISMKALTTTTSPAPGNLTKVVISVSHLVRNTADYITVNLSTPCGYSQSFRFNAAKETTTAIKPSEGKLTPGAIAGIVIGVVAGLIIIFVFVYFCIIKKKTQTQQMKDKESQGTLTQNDDESNNLRNLKKTT